MKTVNIYPLLGLIVGLVLGILITYSGTFRLQPPGNTLNNFCETVPYSISKGACGGLTYIYLAFPILTALLGILFGKIIETLVSRSKNPPNEV
ncbi:MAG: hypothetical protein Q8N84_01605 [bacterium]|nr:hypothetical protein [bacterium]